MLSVYRNYSILLTLTLLLSACFNPAKVSRDSLALLKKEAATYKNLQELSNKIETTSPQTQAHWELLKASAAEFKNYLDLLAALDNTLKELDTKYPKQMRKAVEESLKEEQYAELAKTWGQEHRPLIEDLISRKGDLKVYLASWDFKESPKLIRDISILSKNENKYSLVLPVKKDIYRAKDIDTLLAIFYKISETPKVTTTFALLPTEDNHYTNTTEDCVELAQKLNDSDCASDAASVCSGQMNLTCVQEIINANLDKHCRSRKTTSKESNGDFVSTTLFIENDNSAALKRSIKSCESPVPLF